MKPYEIEKRIEKLRHSIQAVDFQILQTHLPQRSDMFVEQEELARRREILREQKAKFLLDREMARQDLEKVLEEKRKESKRLSLIHWFKKKF